MPSRPSLTMRPDTPGRGPATASTARQIGFSTTPVGSTLPTNQAGSYPQQALGKHNMERTSTAHKLSTAPNSTDTSIGNFDDTPFFQSVTAALRSKLPNAVDWAFKTTQKVSCGRTLDFVGRHAEATILLEELMSERHIYTFLTSEEPKSLFRMSRANVNEEYDDFAPTLEEGDQMESFVQVLELRLVQISAILLNFSTEPSNQLILASCSMVVRFLVRGMAALNYAGLCKQGPKSKMKAIYRQGFFIANTCIEAFANIAGYVVISELEEGKDFLIDTVVAELYSSDRSRVCNSLLVLGHACTLQKNESLIIEIANQSVIERLSELLLVEDLQIAISLLETLYRLTRIWEISTRIAEFHSCLKSLVARLSFRADHFRDQTCIYASSSTTDMNVSKYSISTEGSVAQDALKWLKSNFNATTSKSSTLSRKEMYQAYVEDRAGLPSLTPVLFGTVLRKLFPDLSERILPGSSGNVLYVGVERSINPSKRRRISINTDIGYATKPIVKAESYSVSKVQAPPITLKSSSASLLPIPQTDGGIDEDKSKLPLYPRPSIARTPMARAPNPRPRPGYDQTPQIPNVVAPAKPKVSPLSRPPISTTENTLKTQNAKSPLIVKPPMNEFNKSQKASVPLTIKTPAKTPTPTPKSKKINLTPTVTGKTSSVTPSPNTQQERRPGRKRNNEDSERRFICPTPGCGKAYHNANGLHYHVTSGGCRNVLSVEAIMERDAMEDRPGWLRICDWKDCNRGFKNIRTLAEHVGNYHITKHNYMFGCGWKGCSKFGDGTVRRSNLISHTHYHLTDSKFVKADSDELNREVTVGHDVSLSKLDPSQLALLRKTSSSRVSLPVQDHFLNTPNKEGQNEASHPQAKLREAQHLEKASKSVEAALYVETPLVTEVEILSIRYTAALILRNIAQNPDNKIHLQRFENTFLQMASSDSALSAPLCAVLSLLH